MLQQKIYVFIQKYCWNLLKGEKQKNQKTKSDLFGIWKDYKAVSDVDEYIDELRKSRF